MRKQTLRRLEALEKDERSRKQQQLSSCATTSFFCWRIVLAYYVGGLKSDTEDPGEAYARALNYESRDDYLEALFQEETTEINKRFKSAACRLFAQVELDLDRSPPSALTESFIRMVNQLPEQWLKWLKSSLQEERRRGPIGPEPNMLLEFICPQQEHRQGPVVRDDEAFA
jgi:hypothetical protein